MWIAKAVNCAMMNRMCIWHYNPAWTQSSLTNKLYDVQNSLHLKLLILKLKKIGVTKVYYFTCIVRIICLVLRFAVCSILHFWTSIYLFASISYSYAGKLLPPAHTFTAFSPPVRVTSLKLASIIACKMNEFLINITRYDGETMMMKWISHHLVCDGCMYGYESRTLVHVQNMRYVYTSSHTEANDYTTTTAKRV